MTACPKCDAPGPARYGSKVLRRPALGADGRIGRIAEPVQRFRCAACRHVFADAPTRDAVTEAAVDAVMRSGISAAALRLGIDEASVAGLLSGWLAARDGTVAGMPDVVTATSLRVLGRDCLVLADPVEAKLLDVLPSAGDLPVWIDRHGPPPGFAAIELDGRASAVLAAFGPRPKVMVAPSVARRAIENAAIVSFRALVRDKASKGRNFRESVALLRRPDAALAEAERDDLKAWHPDIRRFRFAVVTLLSDLTDAAAAGFADTMARVVATVAACAPGCALHRLLDRWQDAIVLGVGFRWVDGPLAMVASLKSEIRRLRPTASLDTLRAILLHSDPIAAGRPGILDAVDALRALASARAASPGGQGIIRTR